MLTCLKGQEENKTLMKGQPQENRKKPAIPRSFIRTEKLETPKLS